jgi:hypothetical protein
LKEGAGLAEFALESLPEESREAFRKEAAQLRDHAAIIRKMLEGRITPPLD